jgi:uncharacterized protein YeaO (DUF488 family)
MIYTSYFASKKYNEDKAIAIVAKLPNDIKLPNYKDLAPPYELVQEYKKDHDQSKYILKYTIEVLSKLDPKKVLEDLDESIMLCYEKSGEFCHRHIVGKWLNIYTGVKVIEI